MQTCARCGQENPDVARFCLACGAELRDGAAARQERKVVTVLFADLVGFTSRAESLDPEDVGALLGAYHARLRHELERHGGTVEKFIGDAVMALFGAPVAHEDDPERAVRAAVAIREAVAALNEETDGGGNLRVRTGITTGEALVTIGARPSEGEGMAAGDVVNTAARLQSAAPENGILIDETTRRATEGVVDVEPVGPVVAKGKSEPVRAWEVTGLRTRFGVDLFEDVRTPLVGRETELRLLEQALARARAEHAPQLVTLIGIPGIGKSRLLWELFRIVDADPDLITWRQGRCLPYGDGVALWALGEMIKAQVGLLETDSVTDAEAKLAGAVAQLVGEGERDWVVGHIRPLVGLRSGVTSDPAEAFAAWRRLFEGLALERPLVLVFEDLHWADESLLDFVDHLVDWASGVPLLVVCTARPELIERRPSWGGGKLNATTLALTPLADDAAARLVAALLDQPLLPAELQHLLLEQAAGNPLYAEQYVRMLVDRGLLVRGEAGWTFADTSELPLPETLQGIIAARLDGLVEEEKKLLQDAAVVGKVFWVGALGDGDRAAFEGRLHVLERKGFVRRQRQSSVGGEQEYAFAHVLVRDVAYSQIPRLQRGRKHRAAAEWIERLAQERGGDHAQLAAHHWLQALELTRAAGRHDAELAARASEALADAGDRARSLGSSESALVLYRQALELVGPDDARRPSLLGRYGVVAARQGIDTRAELDEAVAALLADGDPEGAAECLLGKAWYVWNVGATGDSITTIEAARELLAERPPSELKAKVSGELAVQWMLSLDLDRASEFATDELQLAEEVGADGQRANALITFGTTRAISGDPGGIETIEEGLELAIRLNAVETVIRGYKNLQSLLADHAQIERAAAVAADGLRVTKQFGERFHFSWFLVEGAYFAYLQGNWDAALAGTDSFFESLGDRKHYMSGPAWMVRGTILAERGDTAAGLADAETSLEFARLVQDPQQLFPALASNALLLLRAGRREEAAGLVDEALGITFVSTALVDLAFALVLLGRDDEFAQLDDPVRATRWGAAAEAVCRGDNATAAELLAATGAKSYEAEARLLLARQLSLAGRQEEAAREAAAAADFFRGARAERRSREVEILLQTG
jgi:class 3 adenylate cyclase/tetratricopeptide (TPR) repeat protein